MGPADSWVPQTLGSTKTHKRHTNLENGIPGGRHNKQELHKRNVGAEWGWRWTQGKGVGVENQTPSQCNISTHPLSNFVPHKTTTGPQHPHANSIAKVENLEIFGLTC